MCRVPFASTQRNWNINTQPSAIPQAPPLKAFLLQQFQNLKASRNHRLRKTVGVLLVLGGILGFLPILGYWMIPVGLTLLAVDWAWARRLSRRLRVWYGRRIQGRRKKV